MIDFVPEGLVLILHALFGPLPIVDVGSGRVPVKQPSMFIAKRVVLDEQPTVLAVLPAHAPLNGERNPARERVLPLAPQPLDVLGMEDQLAKRRCPHRLDRETGKVERRLIRGHGVPVRVQHDDGLGNGVDHATKLLFVSPELIFSPLQIVDIRVRAVPVDHLAELIALRLDADDEPAVFVVEAPQTHFDLARLPRG